MRSVFVGGVGWISGGKHERSNESCLLFRLLKDDVDEGEAGGDIC